MKQVGPLKTLTTGERTIVLNLLKDRLKDGSITYPQMRLMLRVIGSRSAKETARDRRLRSEVHRVAKKRKLFSSAASN